MTINQGIAIVGAVGVTLLAGWAAVQFWNGLNFIVADKDRFDYDHRLPRAYEARIEGRLMSMQLGLFQYCQHHRGLLPPMDSTAQVTQAIGPYLASYPHDFRNPSTHAPLSPNRALSRLALRRIPSWRTVIAFYDAQPPPTDPVCDYITLDGTIGQTSRTALMQRLRASSQISSAREK